MDRDYKTGKSDSVGIFSGIEIEHTPALGKQTLFLARNDLRFDEIVEIAEKVNAEAIYFGANRTFMHNIANTSQLIKKLMDKGSVEYLYIAGDDDQAIFDWNGGEVKYFLNYNTVFFI